MSMCDKTTKKKFYAKKHLGQHFLIDIDGMYEALHKLHILADPILEIGGGTGILSEALVNIFPDSILHILEIDKDCIKILQKKFKKFPNIHIWEININDTVHLTTLYNACTLPIQLIGNIPYYATKNILTHIFMNSSKYSQCALMLQKEVAESLLSSKNSKYKTLLESFANITSLRLFKKSSFSPEPKVDSIFISITPKEIPLINHIPNCNKFKFMEFVWNFFSYPKKMKIHNKRAHEFSSEQIVKFYLSM